jgi:hypothetical protein
MMEELEGIKQSGKFRLEASGKDLHGELTRRTKPSALSRQQQQIAPPSLCSASE